MPDNLQEWKQARDFMKLHAETVAGLARIKPGGSHALRGTKMFKEYGEEFILDTCKMFIDQNPEFNLSEDHKTIKRMSIVLA